MAKMSKKEAMETARAMNSCGETNSAIAATTGWSDVTVGKWLTEAATTAEEPTDEPPMVTISVDVTEERLNQMWNKLDIGFKGAAIQHALSIEEE